MKSIEEIKGTVAWQIFANTPEQVYIDFIDKKITIKMFDYYIKEVAREWGKYVENHYIKENIG